MSIIFYLHKINFFIVIFFLLFPSHLFPIVLLVDPGHSPKSPGATSCAGAPEYLYNDNLASFIANNIKDKDIRIELSRKPGEERELRERAALSKDFDLFLSIHHDSVQPRFIQKINNAPVSRKASGYSLFISGKNPRYYDSLAFAKDLAVELRRRGLAPSSHHSEAISGENKVPVDETLGIYLYDDLVVLKNAAVPAVLLEAAVIVHPEDEALAISEPFKQIMADAVKSAVAKHRVRFKAQ
ncbi:MAG: N-acetylmuramoyl-L-alanine amidase [Desulfovibrio sp.]|nr:N-acetylmuramoyl-L-alanine amidase [Desulfovibrio sp.]